MKSKCVGLCRWLPILVAVVAVIAVGLITPSVIENQVVLAGPPGSNPHPGVLPLNSKPFGKSYSEWSAGWWQWALETPVNEDGHHPLLTNGEHADTWDECGVGQSGKVWYLGGTFNESGTEERNCNIPTGKAIFFPLLNVETDEIDTGFLEFICGVDIASNPNEENLTLCAQFIADQATVVKAIVDGEVIVNDEVSNKDEFRVLSLPFHVDLPQDDLLGLGPADDVLVVSDGYWIMLTPLSAGSHDIVLGGTFSFTETLDGTPFVFEFSTEVTYHLTVE